jgi:stress responsive alpha/beta barrel protein
MRSIDNPVAGPFVHVACFRWADDTPADHARTVSDALSGLRSQIRATQYFFGADSGLAQGNADFAVVAVFDSVKDYEHYRDHAEHRRILQSLIQPHLSDRSAAQFTVRSEPQRKRTGDNNG